MIGWKTFCALFLAHRYMGPTPERVDEAMADAVAAQADVQVEAFRVADAATTSTLRIAAVRSQIATRIEEQEKRTKAKRLHTEDVRGLVQGMLDSLDGPNDDRKDHRPC